VSGFLTIVVRMNPSIRFQHARDRQLLVPTPSGQQVPISEIARIRQGNGASFIYRENNSRYIGVQFSIEGRDLARAVNQAQDAVRKSVVLPIGYTLDWGGEYSEYVAAREQFALDWTSCHSDYLHDPCSRCMGTSSSRDRDDRRGDDRAGGRLDRSETDAHAFSVSSKRRYLDVDTMNHRLSHDTPINALAAQHGAHAERRVRQFQSDQGATARSSPRRSSRSRGT